jgi:hypothetical protein
VTEADQQPAVFPISMVENPFKHMVQDPKGTGAGAVAVPLAAVPDNWRLQSLKGFFDEYRQRPAWRSGCLRLDPASFVDYVNNYKNDDTTVIFITRILWWKRLTAIFDYHPIGPNLEATGGAAFRVVTFSRKPAQLLQRLPNIRVFYGETP